VVHDNRPRMPGLPRVPIIPVAELEPDPRLWPPGTTAGRGAVCDPRPVRTTVHRWVSYAAENCVPYCLACPEPLAVGPSQSPEGVLPLTRRSRTPAKPIPPGGEFRRSSLLVHPGVQCLEGHGVGRPGARGGNAFILRTEPDVKRALGSSCPCRAAAFGQRNLVLE